GIENAIVNGKRTGTLDSDVTTSNDIRHWWDGLRETGTGATKGNNQAVFAVATAGRIEIGDLRKLRAKMGRYSVNPIDNFYLCGPLAYTQLLGLTDASGRNLVATADKFPPG